MKTVNQILPAGRRSATSQMTKESETQPQYANLCSSHTTKVTEFWNFMGKTFGPAWDTQRGRMVNDEGYASDQFVEWAEGTAHLTDENWHYGFERIKIKMMADLANNRDPFPPATPAIFCAMCFPPELKANQITQAAGQASQSFGKHPNLIARDKEERLAIEQPGRKERVNRAGNTALKNMMKDL